MSSYRPAVLCVDDEPANLRLLEAFLVPRGYEVIKAGNGEEALERIGDRRVDIVLLDVMLPEMNGFEACRRIKEDRRSRNIPVILLTALRSREDRIRGIEAGAEDFISKPFDQGEVLARIRMLLRIKELNDRLNFAYDTMNDLISYGEDIAKTFDPFRFDLGTAINIIISQIIRKTDEAVQKPKTILVGISDEKRKRRWVRYEFTEGLMKSELLDIDVHRCLLVGNGAASMDVIANEADLDRPEVRPLVGLLRPLGIPISNLVSHHSSEFCIIALNYGYDVSSYDAAVLNSLVMQSLFLKSLSGQIRETEDAFAYTVHALARAAEVNDEDTGNHIKRVGEYCGLIAGKLGMPEKFVKVIRVQAQMHDVGKIHIPPDILKKPGKLTSEEFEMVKKHPEFGTKILGDHMRFTMARSIALSHHERWDGSGYPFGLKGEDIPFEGRILNLADVYDALRNRRVYKPAFDHETTYRIITEGDGRTMPHHFDPDVLRVFRDAGSEFEEIYETLRD